MNIDNKNYDEIERERVAKTRQEIVENRRELASCLYKYNGPALKGQGCMLLPGDYMMLQNNKVTSSRGAQIPIFDEQLSDMLDEKIMTGVFDMDDLNADNFDSQLDAVLDEIYRQSTYQDASYYMTNDNNSYGLASYVSEQDPDEIIMQVECENSEFKVLPEIVDKTVVSQLRECTYNEFNPGALEMRAELNKTSSDMKNKTNMYNEMMNEYLSNGRNII